MPSTPNFPFPRLGFVCAASCEATLNRYFLASPCVAAQTVPCLIRYGAASAAEVFNGAMAEITDVDWWIWVHQDVLLPGDWLGMFRQRLHEALQRWPNLAVAGAYGIAQDGQRAGHVLDRGKLLRESTALPCLAQGLDELLVAVRNDSGVMMDAALGFDFYASDLALQAEQGGLTAAVLDIYCEHWSTTPMQAPYAAAFLERLERSANAFEKKWQDRLPVYTPCLPLTHVGSAATLLRSING